jgi:hypothetical protein
VFCLVSHSVKHKQFKTSHCDGRLSSDRLISTFVFSRRNWLYHHDLNSVWETAGNPWSSQRTCKWGVLLEEWSYVSLCIYISLHISLMILYVYITSHTLYICLYVHTHIYIYIIDIIYIYIYILYTYVYIYIPDWNLTVDHHCCEFTLPILRYSFCTNPDCGQMCFEFLGSQSHYLIGNFQPLPNLWGRPIWSMPTHNQVTCNIFIYYIHIQILYIDIIHM